MGSVDARLTELAEQQNAKWAAINLMRQDIAAIRESLAEHRQIFAEHRACQERIGKLEQTSSYSRGVVATMTVLGSLVGTIATLVVKWVEGRHP